MQEKFSANLLLMQVQIPALTELLFYAVAMSEFFEVILHKLFVRWC